MSLAMCLSNSSAEAFEGGLQSDDVSLLLQVVQFLKEVAFELIL
jgi:hypothetical protein